MLTSAQLDQMRADVAELLPDSCSILSNARTSDGAGGWSDNWTVSATVACRADPITQRDSSELFAKQDTANEMLQFTVPHDTSVSTQNRVRYDGNDYDIVEATPSKTWSVSVRFKAMRKV